MLECWNERCSPPWPLIDLLKKVSNAYSYGIETPGAAAAETDFTPIRGRPDAEIPAAADGNLHPYDILNREYAFVIAGGGAHILWETTDKDARFKLEHLAVSAFHQKHASAKLIVGKKEEPVTTGWMEWSKRRSYDGLVFDPSRRAPSRFYNLWRGFAYEPLGPDEPPTPEMKESLDAWLDHARRNVCRGDADLFRWLIGYFANLVQSPERKPLVSIVFRGPKGVGKNALVERVGALLGNHCLVTSSKRYLVGNFNSHLESCLLLVLDEAFWSGDKQAEGTLKDLITGAQHVIEHKGKEPYTVDNRTRVCIIGNEDWIVPMSHDERRFAVFDVGEGRKQDRAFFREMRERMEAGGYRLLLRYLLDYDLTGVDLDAAPATAAAAEQKHLTLEPIQEWWLECLTAGRILGGDFGDSWPAQIECVQMREYFSRYTKGRNIRSRLPTDRQVGRQLKPFMRHDRGRLGKMLAYFYFLKPLAESRGDWDRWIGHAVEWPS